MLGIQNLLQSCNLPPHCCPSSLSSPVMCAVWQRRKRREGWWCQEVRDSNALLNRWDTFRSKTEGGGRRRRDSGQADRSADKHAGLADSGLETGVTQLHTRIGWSLYTWLGEFRSVSKFTIAQTMSITVHLSYSNNSSINPGQRQRQRWNWSPKVAAHLRPIYLCWGLLGVEEREKCAFLFEVTIKRLTERTTKRDGDIWFLFLC